MMAAGDTPNADLAKGIERGLWVTRFNYVNVVKSDRAVLTGLTKDGTFLIENGEVTRPVKNLRFTQGVLDAWSGLRALGAERRLMEGWGGAVLAPAMRLDALPVHGGQRCLTSKRVRPTEPDLDELERRLGVTFKDRALLRQALIHKSLTNDLGESGLGSNERLEFLGDSVLGMLVSRAAVPSVPGPRRGPADAAAVGAGAGVLAGRLGARARPRLVRDGRARREPWRRPQPRRPAEQRLRGRPGRRLRRPGLPRGEDAADAVPRATSSRRSASAR